METKTDDTLVLIDPLHPIARFIFGAGGLAALVLPAWDFGTALLHPSIFSLFLWVIVLGAAAVGAVFLAGAILGDSTVLRVSPGHPAPRIELSRRNPLRRRHEVLAPTDILTIEVKKHEWESRPPTWDVHVRFARGQPVSFGEFTSPHGAELLANRLKTVLAPS